MNTSSFVKRNMLTSRNVGVVALLGLSVALASKYLPVAYYGISLLEKATHATPWWGHKPPPTIVRPGEEWLNEQQTPIEIEALLREPWIGIQWTQENGPAKLLLDPGIVDPATRTIPVKINNTRHGPIEILLNSQGRHSYRGLPICGHHGGEVTDQAIIVRCFDNRLRVVVKFSAIGADDVDMVFKRVDAQ